MGHFSQKSPITSGSFAKNDMRLRASNINISIEHWYYMSHELKHDMEPNTRWCRWFDLWVTNSSTKLMSHELCVDESRTMCVRWMQSVDEAANMIWVTNYLLMSHELSVDEIDSWWGRYCSNWHRALILNESRTKARNMSHELKHEMEPNTRL